MPVNFYNIIMFTGFLIWASLFTLCGAVAEEIAYNSVNNDAGLIYNLMKRLGGKPISDVWKDGGSNAPNQIRVPQRSSSRQSSAKKPDGLDAAAVPLVNNNNDNGNSYPYNSKTEGFEQGCPTIIENGSIIKTTESITAGAEYIDSLKNVRSNDDCMNLCCQNKSCDVSVYQNKGERYCYLFKCAGRCLFKPHSGYFISTIQGRSWSEHPEEDLQSLTAAAPAQSKQGDTSAPVREALPTPDSIPRRPEVPQELPQAAPKQVTVQTQTNELIIAPHSVGLGGFCSLDIHCEDPNAGCLHRNCGCKAEFYNKEGICRKVCLSSEFECFDLGTLSRGPECISQGQVCDSYLNCADGSDEFNCENLASNSQVNQGQQQTVAATSSVKVNSEGSGSRQGVRPSAPSGQIGPLNTSLHKMVAPAQPQTYQPSQASGGSPEPDRNAAPQSKVVAETQDRGVSDRKPDLYAKESGMQLNSNPNPNTPLSHSQAINTKLHAVNTNVPQTDFVDTDGKSANLADGNFKQTEAQKPTSYDPQVTPNEVSRTQDSSNQVVADTVKDNKGKMYNQNTPDRHLEGFAQSRVFPNKIQSSGVAPGGNQNIPQNVQEGEDHDSGNEGKQADSGNQLLTRPQKGFVQQGQSQEGSNQTIHRIRPSPNLPVNEQQNSHARIQQNSQIQPEDSVLKSASQSKTPFIHYPQVSSSSKSLRPHTAGPQNPGQMSSRPRTKPQAFNKAHSKSQNHNLGPAYSNPRKWIDPNLYSYGGQPDSSPQEQALVPVNTHYYDPSQYYPPYDRESLDQMPESLVENNGPSEDFSQFGGPDIGSNRPLSLAYNNQNPAYQGYPETSYGGQYPSSNRYEENGDYKSAMYQDPDFYSPVGNQQIYRPGVAGIYEEFPSRSRPLNSNSPAKRPGHGSKSSVDVNKLSTTINGSIQQTTGAVQTTPSHSPEVTSQLHQTQPMALHELTTPRRQHPQEYGTKKHIFLSSEKVIIARASDAEGPIVALSLGLAFTLILLVLLGCRLRHVRHRLRKGRPLHQNEADYLINGMYL